jgi:hypothetical protein
LLTGSLGPIPERRLSGATWDKAASVEAPSAGDVSEARRMKALEGEDTRLKRILSDTKLDDETLGTAS